MKKIILLNLMVIMLILNGCINEKQTNYELIINDVENGTVTGEGEYKEGEIAILKALPKEEYKFAYWELGGKFIFFENPLEILMDENKEISVVFAKLEEELTLIYPKKGETIEYTKNIELNWEKEETEETYKIYFGESLENMELLGETTENKIIINKKLDWDTKYYWDVVRENGKKLENISSFSTFNPDNLYGFMKEVYLWNENMPTDIDYSQYTNYNELLGSMLYSPELGGYDHWSFIISYEEYKSWSENSEYKGVGFSFLWQDDNLMIKRVYKDSPGDVAGLERGDRILSINGYDIVEKGKEYFEENIEEILAGDIMDIKTKKNGVEKENSIKKEIVQVHPVQEKKIFKVGEKKVGYLVFDTFEGKADEELEEAFGEFKTKGINELVLDLRYNGGGSLGISLNLASLILDNTKKGEVFTTLTYNELLENYGWGSIYEFKEKENSLNLQKLYVITTKGSASASEYLINGLEPFMDVIIVGDDTHGKPVGMNVMGLKDGKYNNENPENMILPIMFKGVNSLGEFDEYKFITENEEKIFDGLRADYKEIDDIYNELGSEDEACLKACLCKIENDEFPQKSQKRSLLRIEQFENRRFRSLIGAY
ncbi:MAG: hypothetical protein B6I28_05245 [Fusobacteriia bacterium 4572_132]|nr:MAG: hypothetical protein B6I28_05245 [Fusobacteriia bacterium 4572_132]